MLQGKLLALGWRDCWARLTLFEAFVRSVLLYGGAIWGVSVFDPQGRVGTDVSGQMGAFYRGCLRSLLDVDR